MECWCCTCGRCGYADARERSFGPSRDCANNSIHLRGEDSVNRTSIMLMAIATVLAAGPASAQTRPTAQEEMGKAQFFVGKWNCANNVGELSATYATHYASSLERAWLAHTSRMLA